MSKWFYRFNSDNVKMRVIFLPYAGGSASIYQDWIKHLSPGIEAILVQLPGRASRFGESLISSMDEITSELSDIIDELSDLPYIVFGHSMGSRIGYQLLTHLRESGHPLPKHFIASGCKAPHQERHMSGSHLLPEDEFINEIKRLNATPEEVLQNKALLNLCIQILRADFEIADHQSPIPKLKHSTRCTLFFGLLDQEVDMDDIEEWQKHFSDKVNVKLFNGEHFFIHSHKEKVINEINKIFIQEERN
ncbi:thioesterase II family protein [Photobacterium sp. TY1-4]|uniref:thioesterase II family protein n=1 Tax=Photobacterium sp. TY1-4 TaxID=2899122 RepID=UPI0021C1B941|nr:thioesterase domain-containing protein [Photobacterium sp. TY1-4]UXI00912.1 thioesterase domain-containing protein [Photobacterium sp. TY1-4]